MLHTVNELFVNLVGNNVNTAFLHEFRDVFHFLFAVYGARRVVGRIENKALRLRRAGFFEIFRRHFIALLLSRGHIDGFSAGKSDEFGIGQPIRRRKQNLVSFFHDSFDCKIK